MKTRQTPEGTVVEEPILAVDVVFAGLGALVSYYEEVSPMGPYALHAFRMCEEYCAMMNDIAVRGGKSAYNTHFQEFLGAILERSKLEGKDGRQGEEDPQG